MRFIMYYSSFETLLTCKFEFFSDTGWANKNYHFLNPFRPFSEVKKNISTFIKKNFFHYNVSNSGNIRSYCTDWFSVNFFASFFSLFIDLTSPNDDYKFIFRSFKIITRYCSVQLTRRKRPSNPFQLNAKWTKPFKRRTLRLNRIKRERERDSSLWPKFSFHVRFRPSWPRCICQMFPRTKIGRWLRNIWHSVGKLVPGHAQ